MHPTQPQPLAGQTAAAISRLNDTLRQHRLGGIVQLSRGISQLDPATQSEVLSAVAAFDGFCPDNDPYGEHDCATVTVGHHAVIWKIDYYDPTLSAGSQDPANPSLTTRVLTIMLAEEY